MQSHNPEAGKESCGRDGGKTFLDYPRVDLSHRRPSMAPAPKNPRKGARSGAGAAALTAVVAALFLCPPARPAEAEGSLSSTPLAIHPFPRGKTLYTQLAPQSTGVLAENHYDDPKMWGELYQEFEGGSMGTGVAIGDFDGDGRPDLFVVTKTGGCHLYRNLGSYRFEDVTEKAGVGGTPGIWNQGATFVDINNSGRLDLYVCRYNAPNLLYINQGDGTFKERAHAYGLDIKDGSGMASFCDYDRDGFLDVYIATNILNIATHPNGQRGYLLHNNRNGTFTDITEAAGISGETQSHSATWWDFDGDGWPDLYVANDYGLPDRLYRNNRDGTFTDVLDQVAPHTSFSSMGADLGDVNNGGRIDLLVADMAATSHEKDQHSIADARGRTEEAPNSSAAPKYHRNALLMSTGAGHLLEAANLCGLAATDWTWSVRLEDLDNDGHTDLFVTNGFNRDPSPDVNRRLMNAETAAERIRIMRDAPMLPQTHLAFRNLGDLHFENVSSQWGLDLKGISFGAALGDLSGDGNLDIVYTNYEGNVTLLRNDEDSAHRGDIDLRGILSNHFGVGATVRVESALGTQTQQLVLARGYMSSSEPMIHFGFGNDTLIRRMVVTWPSGATQTFQNLPVDRRYRVTEPAQSSRLPPASPPPGAFAEVSQLFGLSIKSREEAVDETDVQKLLPRRLNSRGPGLAVGDTYGSGRDDLVVGGTTLDPLRLFHATASGHYLAVESPVKAPGSVDDGPVLLFDSAGTGRPDLLVTKGGNALPAGSPEYQPQLFLNDGGGHFHAAPDGVLPPYLASAGAVAAADFDHSGRLGLFIGGRVQTGQYPLSPQSALLANRGGIFEDVTDTLAPSLRRIGMVTSALWSDVDQDGWPDLLVTLEWGPVRYFHNTPGRGFEDWTDKSGFASAGTGWWTSIAAADFNGDGHMDYVVGNVGLNTHYTASPERPALLFSGPFKPGGSAQLIEAYYEGDKLYPWRSRTDLGKMNPAILKRFPTFDSYGRASLAEILGEDRLAKARRFAATELRSGVLMSQPDGTYRFEPLPRIAQIAPLQGMVAGDFAGSGHADIYAVQNSYAPIPSVGRFDGGLSQLLRGDGHGHFTPASPLESGLVVPGDAKALCVADLDQAGLPAFVVSRNNDSLLVFRNQTANTIPLRITLHGRPGNPTAVGARVTVEFADQSSQTCEIEAGSGYYSQSTAAGFFGFNPLNPPKKIRVHWPSGLSTEQAFIPPNPVLILEEPPGPAP